VRHDHVRHGRPSRSAAPAPECPPLPAPPPCQAAAATTCSGYCGGWCRTGWGGTWGRRWWGAESNQGLRGFPGLARVWAEHERGKRASFSALPCHGRGAGGVVQRKKERPRALRGPLQARATERGAGGVVHMNGEGPGLMGMGPKVGRSGIGPAKSRWRLRWQRLRRAMLLGSSTYINARRNPCRRPPSPSAGARARVRALQQRTGRDCDAVRRHADTPTREPTNTRRHADTPTREPTNTRRHADARINARAGTHAGIVRPAGPS
jgi:hypothetical protein